MADVDKSQEQVEDNDVTEDNRDSDDTLDNSDDVVTRL